jgi:hypothetical protein
LLTCTLNFMEWQPLYFIMGHVLIYVVVHSEFPTVKFMSVTCQLRAYLYILCWYLVFDIASVVSRLLHQLKNINCVNVQYIVI